MRDENQKKRLRLGMSRMSPGKGSGQDRESWWDVRAFKRRLSGADASPQSRDLRDGFERAMANRLPCPGRSA